MEVFSPRYTPPRIIAFRQGYYAKRKLSALWYKNYTQEGLEEARWSSFQQFFFLSFFLSCRDGGFVESFRSIFSLSRVFKDVDESFLEKIFTTQLVLKIYNSGRDRRGRECEMFIVGYIFGQKCSLKACFSCYTSNLILVNEAKRGEKARLTSYSGGIKLFTTRRISFDERFLVLIFAWNENFFIRSKRFAHNDDTLFRLLIRSKKNQDAIFFHNFLSY